MVRQFQAFFGTFFIFRVFFASGANGEVGSHSYGAVEAVWWLLGKYKTKLGSFWELIANSTLSLNYSPFGSFFKCTIKCPFNFLKVTECLQLSVKLVVDHVGTNLDPTGALLANLTHKLGTLFYSFNSTIRYSRLVFKSLLFKYIGRNLLITHPPPTSSSNLSKNNERKNSLGTSLFTKENSY